MLFSERVGDAGAALAALVKIASAQLRKEHVHEVHLRYPRADGAELKRAFIRAAQQRHIRKLRAGGIGKVRDKYRAQPALPCVGQRLDKVLRRAGIGEEEDNIVFTRGGDGD